MSFEPKIEFSNLSQKITSEGRTVSVEIYRLEGEKEWTLEIVDEFNNSTAWEETFSTESAAITEAKQAIIEEQIATFIGPEDGISDDGKWK